MPVKIADGGGYFDRWCLEQALDWASQAPGPAQIISMSFVCDPLYATTLEPRFRARYLEGVPLIAGAGNGGAVGYPASSPYVLAVGETNNEDDTVG